MAEEDKIILPVDVTEAMSRITSVISATQKLTAGLSKVKGPEALITFFTELSESLKTQQILLKGYGSSLSTMGQKFSQVQQTTSAALEKSASKIGIAARQYERALKAVSDAEKGGSITPAANVRALAYKTAADAAAAYQGGVRKLQNAIKELDAQQGKAANVGALNTKRAAIEREAIAVAALKQRMEELVAVEKEAGEAATLRAKQEEQGAIRSAAEWKKYYMAGSAEIAAWQKEAADAVALRVKQEEEGAIRSGKEWTDFYAMQSRGIREVAAMQREAAAQAKALASSQVVPGVPTAGGGLASKFARQASTFANYAGIAAVLGGGGAVISQVVKLDEALHNLQGITQTSDAGMAQLRDKILEVSAASKFMASDVANAATILGQAGLSASQIGDALKAVVIFAQGAGTTLDESVNLITSAMGAFGLRASEAMTVANAFTSALNNSKLTVAQLSTGFQYSATSAAQLGMSYTELVTTMQLMADAGIKSGSMIGTGIRQILNQLATPNQRLRDILVSLGVTLNDVDVRAHGLAQVMETLKSKGFDATDAFQAFGTRGASAFIALESQVDSFNEKLRENTGTSAALKAAETQMESLANTARNTGAKIAAAAAQGFAPMVTAVTGAIKVVGVLVSAMQALGPVFDVATTALVVFGVVQAAKYISSLVSMTGLTKSLTLAVQEFTAAQLLGTSATEAFLAVVSPELLVIAGITAAIVAFSYSANALANAQSAAAAATEAAKGRFDAAKTTYDEVGNSIQTLINRHNDLKDGSKDLEAVTADLGQRYQKLGIDVDKLSQHYDGLLERMRQIQGMALKEKANALTDLANQNSKQAGVQYAAVEAARQSALIASDSGVLRGVAQSNPVINQLIAALKSGVPTTSAANSGISGLLAQVRGIDQTGMSEGQKNTLNRFVDGVDKMTGEVSKLTNIYSQGGSIKLDQRAANMQGTAGYQAFQNKIQDQQIAFASNYPHLAGKDAVADLAVLQKYEDGNLAVLKADLKEAQNYASTSAAHYAAMKPVLVQLNGAIGNATQALKKAGQTAKEQLNSGAALQQKVASDTVQSGEQALGQARTVGQANAAEARIKAAQAVLTKAAIEKEGIKLQLTPGRDFTVADDGTVTYLRPVTETTKNMLSLATDDERQKVIQQQQAFQSKLGSINRRETSAGNAAARGDIQNDITVLEAELAAYIRDQATQLKKFDKNSPNTDVEAAYAAIIHDINMEVARQIDIARAKFNKLGHTPSPMEASQEAAIEQAIRDQGDDKREAALNARAEATSSGTRLPSSFADAWRNIQKFSEDARKTIATDVNDLATLFQDVMEAAITTVKSSLATLWSSIIDGTASVGGALKQFAKSILESIATTASQHFAQQAISGLMSVLPGSLGSALGGATKDIAITANTVSTDANTVAITGLTTAMAAGSATGSAGGIAGGLSGSAGMGKAGAGSWMDDIGGFFSKMFDKIGSFISQIASAIGSALSSAASGIGDFFASLFNQGGAVGLAGGGFVPGALRTRDSVYKRLNTGDFVMRQTAASKIMGMAGGGVMTKLTPGEFVIPKHEARAIGYKNLSRMNFDASLQHLAAGGMAGMSVGDALGSNAGNRMDAASVRARDPYTSRLHQGDKKHGQGSHTTNVWVVKPEERPTMTKNDVLVAIGEDILANGNTKKLIKSVQAGF